MSLLPFIMGLGLHHPPRPMEQDFRPGLTPDDIFTAASQWRDYHYYSPWTQQDRRDIDSPIKTDKEKFQLNLDVQHFAPEEISVKTADGFIVVEGKHEEKRDGHGYISRQFTRRYPLPEGSNTEGVESRLSSDGVLTVIAPRVAPLKNERSVPIRQTGPVRRKVELVEGRASPDKEDVR